MAIPKASGPKTTTKAPSKPRPKPKTKANPKTKKKPNIRNEGKGKYSPEVVDAICRGIELTGRDSEGFKYGGISKQTFYTWLREKPDFFDRIASSRNRYRQKLWADHPDIYEKAIASIERHLDGLEQEWEIEGKTTDGKTYSKKTKTKKDPAPWAIMHVLGIRNDGGKGSDLGSGIVTEQDTQILSDAMKMVTELMD